jgi:hypothetical protein
MSKYSEEWLEREFIGYGLEQPNPNWPGGAKICVSFVVQYYMGAVSFESRLPDRVWSNAESQGTECTGRRRDML